jgi:glycerophosphoryl diester phosphodiesterase
MAVLMAAFSVKAVEIIAHRGASWDAPENTVASAKLGYEQGADACECDIYLTKDGKIMLMHDRDTLRTTGATNRMAETTSKELRKLDVGQWGKWQGKGFSEPVPYLHEVLEVMPAGKGAFIEIKTGPEILPELKKQLAASGKKDKQLTIISFNYEVCKQAKQMMPQYKVYFLQGSDSKTKKFPPVEDLIKMAVDAKLDGLNLNYGFPIDKEFVRKVHGAGLKLYTWTVNDAEVARRQVQAGVDGITTDRPAWLREQLNLTAKR